MNLPSRGGHPLTSIWILGVFLLLLPGCSRHQDAAPRSPRESLQSMQVHPDFRVELFASEPDVVDPVEMAYPVRTRFQVLDLLLDRKERLGLLLEALESGAIEVGALDWARKEKLLSHPDPGVAARAAELLGEAGRDRERAVQAYLQGANLQ